MKLPSLLPPELAYLKIATNDHQLFRLLQKLPEDLSVFFEYAVEDEGWCSAHIGLMQMLGNWLTVNAFSPRLEAKSLDRVIHAIWKHTHYLLPFFPKDRVLCFGEERQPVNSLLWSFSSPFFRQLFKDQHGNREVFLKAVSKSQLSIINQFIEQGAVDQLLYLSEDEIRSLLTLTSEWRITKLSEALQLCYARYIDRENYFDLLVEAHENSWQIVLERAVGSINRDASGIQIFVENGRIGVEWSHFHDHAFALFNEVEEQVSLFAFHGELPDKTTFSTLINQCRHLVGIDFSETKEIDELLTLLPPTVVELNLSRCQWLGRKQIEQLAQHLPAIWQLKLQHNRTLDANCFALLGQLHALEEIDLSDCSQIDDEQLKLILAALPLLRTLSLNRCQRVGNAGFEAIGRFTPGLMTLNVAGSNLSDSALITLSTHCKQLRRCDLRGCKNLTPSAVQKAFKNLPLLEEGLLP